VRKYRVRPQDELVVDNDTVVRMGQSSPGSLQSVQGPSKGIRQMPHVSSSTSHFHTATAVHLQRTTLLEAKRARLVCKTLNAADIGQVLQRTLRVGPTRHAWQVPER